MTLVETLRAEATLFAAMVAVVRDQVSPQPALSRLEALMALTAQRRALGALAIPMYTGTTAEPASVADDQTGWPRPPRPDPGRGGASRLDSGADSHGCQ